MAGWSCYLYAQISSSMRSFFVLILALLLVQPLLAQPQNDADTSWKTIYRATPEKQFNLVHTRLNAFFDIPKAELRGQVWITVKPHFYEQNVLVLDAKGMELREVSLVKGATRNKLKFNYDSTELTIQLDRPYRRTESITVYLDYIARPNNYKGTGSAAITDAKGLYFINPTGSEKNKPTQFWTQGETEGTSVWVPTIDKPNQKTTQEINMTVPAKWVTLSNGKLVSQKVNTNGTRTDSWKMDQPHAPYLFFMGAGEFAVIKDTWRGKEVSYYVEKEYGPVARKIFGMTPEMMTYFSRITGVPYPWVKYSQIVGRDYVSGAMENTTATLHQESAQQDARELLDGNSWEGTIAHELFHHWFGDLVTTESWSNLTINESFANYSEYLWDEYKYGKDKAAATHYNAMQGYLGSNSEKKDLVRFYYKDKEDMFDAVSYNKGGRILHMLRNYVGDSAFFQSLQLFLNQNRFKAAEAHQLRLAFEEVTGKDLNWFFNQWFFGSGHPTLDISYSYDDAAKAAKVVVKQTQKEKVFVLPVAIDVYEGASRTRHQVWVRNTIDSFLLPSNSKPSLVQFDGDRMLLATRKENKNLDEYIHQYKHAGHFMDRREAIDFISKRPEDPKAIAFMQDALKDTFSSIRSFVISKIDVKRSKLLEATEPLLLQIAEKDPSRVTRSRAVEVLGNTKKAEYKTLFIRLTNDSSYTLSGAALTALGKVDTDAALTEAKRLGRSKSKGDLLEAIATTLIKSGDETAFDAITEAYNSMGLSQAKFNLSFTYANFLGVIRDTEKVKKGIDAITGFRDQIPEQFGIYPVFDNMLKTVIGKKEEAKKSGADLPALQEQIDYIKSKMKN